MYKVLYRKYRPRFFADVIGQPQVTTTLKNEIVGSRLAHAYLFAGSRGTGKTTCAKILSKAVNCLNPQNGDPCGECEICRGVEDGSIMDVVEIDAASNNGVDSIRSLIEEANFTPANTKYRVYIIDEVHMLSVPAFNALLKTLEEPPEHVIFILATTEVHKLLPTILSRCQRFDFRRIAPEDIAKRLVEIAQKEDAELEEDAALLLAMLADGAMRDALSLLDQCLGRSREVTVEVVNSATGASSKEYLYALAGAVIDNDPAQALELIDELHQGSKDMNRLCEELAEYFRKLMLIKTMRNPSKVIVATKSEMEKMTNQALPVNLSVITHALEALEEALNRMKYANQRIELEMAMVRLCSPELDSSTAALVRRIESLEKGRPSASQTVPLIKMREEKPREKAPEEDSDKLETFNHQVQEEAVPEPEPVPEQKPKPEPPRTARNPGGMNIEELSEAAVRFNDWPEILEAIKEYSTSVAAAFRGSAAYVNGDYILIEAPQIAFDLLKRGSQRDKIRDEIKRITGRVYKLGPYKKKKSMEEQEDPLDRLAKMAEETGINTEVK